MELLQAEADHGREGRNGGSQNGPVRRGERWMTYLISPTYDLLTISILFLLG